MALGLVPTWVDCARSKPSARLTDLHIQGKINCSVTLECFRVGRYRHTRLATALVRFWRHCFRQDWDAWLRFDQNLGGCR